MEHSSKMIDFGMQDRSLQRGFFIKTWKFIPMQLWILILILGCESPQSYSHRLFSDIKEITLEKVPYPFEVSGIAVNSIGEIFCWDIKNSRVLCFGPDGSFLRQIGRRDRYSGEFRYPRDLVIGQNDDLYIACSDSVYIFSSNGRRKDAFEVNINIQSIAIDPKGYVYLSGYKPDGVVHKYSPKGKLLKSFGEIFEHDDARIQRMYSGGALTVVEDRLFLTHITPYKIVAFDFGGRVINQIQRPELNFRPNFKITNKGYQFRMTSQGRDIQYWNNKIINAFHILDKGTLLDFYDIEGNIIIQDIPFNAQLLSADQDGSFFYRVGSNSEMSFFRGRLIVQKE